jgi:hypothetical protein
LPLALLAACSDSQPADRKIDASRYRSFFLWSGVRPPPYLAQADSVYLLWGELRRGDPSRIAVLRPEPPRNPGPALWLVVRAERLDWGSAAYRQLIAETERWRREESRFAGVQVDFDAATLRLGSYAAFLRDLRRRLPAGVRLSATGLMDWSANAPPDDLASLAGVVDEVVIQTYQGRATIPGYQHYLPSLVRLKVPYRVGLVEGGEWAAPASLAQDPQFKGYVVFLDGSANVT